jgi:putative DNA primase/helicase
VASCNHPFISERRGVADGLYVVPEDFQQTIVGRDVKGWLAAPLKSLSGQLHAIHFISSDGKGCATATDGEEHDGMLVIGTIDAEQSVYVCARLQDAWSCSRVMNAAAIVALDVRRFATVVKAIRARYAAVRIVLVGTREEAPHVGIVARHSACSYVVMPLGEAAARGPYDLERDSGEIALGRLLSDFSTPQNRYILESANEFAATAAQKWLVARVLPSEGVAAIFGPSRSGKSFLALDLCAAVSTGVQWFGRRVTAVSVTYLVLEGAAGFGKRLSAIIQRKGGQISGRLSLVRQSLDLRSHSHLSELASAILANGRGGGMVVVDTLSQAAIGADENSSVDMGALIAGCNWLQRAVGGLVVIVHHTGKDGAKGLRGHSSLLAALDAAIEVRCTGGRREWTLAKSKDEVDGGKHGFSLEPVNLGVDENEEAITSCIVASDAAATLSSSTGGPTGKNQVRAFDYLQIAFTLSPTFGQGGAPQAARCVSHGSAVLEVSKLLVEVDPKHRKERAKEAINQLVSRGVFRLTGAWLHQA